MNSEQPVEDLCFRGLIQNCSEYQNMTLTVGSWYILWYVLLYIENKRSLTIILPGAHLIKKILAWACEIYWNHLNVLNHSATISNERSELIDPSRQKKCIIQAKKVNELRCTSYISKNLILNLNTSCRVCRL